jgi:hypothetical protein
LLGAQKVKKGSLSGLGIDTSKFSIEDVKKFRKFLLKQFDLKTNIHIRKDTNKSTLYIPKAEIKKIFFKEYQQI